MLLQQHFGAALSGAGAIAYAAFIVAVPLIGHIVSPVLGILLAFVLVSATAILMPGMTLIVILFSFMFQNLIVSLLSGYIASDTEFDMIRAYNFFTVCITWLTVAVLTCTRYRPLPTMLVRFLKWTMIALVLVGLYFVLGFTLYGMAAVVNLRNVAMPLLLFQISITLLAIHPVRLGPPLAGLGMLAMMCGFVEFVYRDFWLEVTNSVSYWNLTKAANWMSLALDKSARETGIVATGLTDTFRITFFNSPILEDIGIRVMRLFGPNMHAISFAYSVALFAMFALFRGRMLQATLLLLLLMLCSVKGAVLTVFMASVSFCVFLLFGGRVALGLHCIAACAFAVLGIVVGRQIGDFHVLGLMSGLREFLSNPLGHGIGAGGNLSPLFDTIDWSEAQSLGYTPFPVESSVGVLLYQMGLSAVLVIGCYIWIARHLVKLADYTGHPLHAGLGFAILWVVTNGLFQEEAYFAPLALASLLAFAGVVLGAAIQSGALDAPSSAMKQNVR